MLSRVVDHLPRRHLRGLSKPSKPVFLGASAILIRAMSESREDARLTRTFTLPESRVSVTHPASVDETQLLSFPAFKNWLTTLDQSLSLQRNKSHPFHSSPYALRSIEVQAVDYFGGHRLGFVKLRATVTNDAGESLPGSVFMRGGSVAMLIILRPESSSQANSETSGSEDPEYVILTLQPRIAAGSLSFVELPAGMIDDSGSFAGAAAKEIREETGLEISGDELLDMTELARQTSSEDDEPHLQAAVYPSPGGSDEFIPIFLARKTLPLPEIEELRGKLTGLRDDDEKITLKIVPLGQVWKVAGRDGKTLAAMALYQGLKGEGRL